MLRPFQGAEGFQVLGFQVLAEGFQSLEVLKDSKFMIKVGHLAEAYTQDFLMEDVSVTLHRDDVKILQLRQFRGIMFLV